jgi:hypothetical protein
VAAAPPATPAASASQPPGLVTKVRSLIDDLQREGPWDSKQEALASLALTLATTIEDGGAEAKSIPSLSKELRGVIADLTAQRGAGDDPDGWLDAPPVRDAAQSGAGHPRA